MTNLKSAEPLPLTGRQGEVLALVATYYQAVGEGCPSLFVARRLKLHHETVREHYLALYRKGWLVSENSPATPRRPFLERRSV